MNIATCVWGLLAALMFQWAAPPQAEAQPFPNRPIRAIQPFTPGGFGEVFLRALGAELGKSPGQSWWKAGRGR